jgi:hypothetical protein
MYVTGTGRMSGMSSNIQYLARAWIYEKCRQQHRPNYEDCEKCRLRFECFTASKPDIIKFIDAEVDYKQIELRLMSVAHSMTKELL